MSDLSQAAWREQLEKDTEAIIIDVRTDEEVAEGMIPKAEHIDIFQSHTFIGKVQAMDASKKYYVYCKSGGRSAQACAIMNQMGIESTFNLVGGFTDWTGEVAYP